jgi:hypothetical protein
MPGVDEDRIVRCIQRTRELCASIKQALADNEYLLGEIAARLRAIDELIMKERKLLATSEPRLGDGSPR